MNFAKRCRHEIPTAIWREAEEIEQGKGLVQALDYIDEQFFAEVREDLQKPDESFLTLLDLNRAGRGFIRTWCECPKFHWLKPCKHVAATLVHLDRTHFPVPGMSPVTLTGEFGKPYIPKEVLAKKGAPLPVAKKTQPSEPPPAPRVLPPWEKRLAPLLPGIHRQSDREWPQNFPLRSRKKQLWYLLNQQASLEYGCPAVTLFERVEKKDGTLGKFQAARFRRDEIDFLEPAEDRELVELLFGNDQEIQNGYTRSSMEIGGHCFLLTPPFYNILFPRLSQTGRFGFHSAGEVPTDETIRSMTWDDGPPWAVELSVEPHDQSNWIFVGNLTRSLLKDGTEIQETIPVTAGWSFLSSGLFYRDNLVSRWVSEGNFDWIRIFLENRTPILIPRDQHHAFLETLGRVAALPRFKAPTEWNLEESVGTPIPRLVLARSARSWDKYLEARVEFRYGEKRFPLESAESALVDATQKKVIRRHSAKEKSHWEFLLTTPLKAQSDNGFSRPGLLFAEPGKIPQLVATLATAGWEIESEGNLVRAPGRFQIEVKSGIDWFDLKAQCDFGGVNADLPSLLKALKDGQTLVSLTDGTQGLLPVEWLDRFGSIAQLGQIEEGQIRFQTNQALLLDALLAAQEQERVQADEAFAQLQEKLRNFEAIRPGREPGTFGGTLRTYQREGLGWLEFLDELGMGGCLADDMGLGKTVQVLSLLEKGRLKKSAGELAPDPKAWDLTSPTAPKKTKGKKTAKGKELPPEATSTPASQTPVPRPSLVVVPKSLVFNWIEEAGRFAPHMKVLNHTGQERHVELEKLKEYDLVITTYGVVRRDIAKWKQVQWDWVIIDEAQAIKNASSQSAKACRLLQARRRLAMTGTPVENHLGELWSIFEFLNPGMLGQSSQVMNAFNRAKKIRSGLADASPTQEGNTAPGNSDSKGLGPDTGKEPSAELAILARALRPFLLRRTKEEVLSDLPEKTEQTLYCELAPHERKQYEDLKEHYRQSLLGKVRSQGIKKAQVQVLEALLRLRQASCHPGLLDPSAMIETSAKLETLLEQLEEIRQGGHKALVFSQFTQFLGIVRMRLDQLRIPYEYLDGKTTNRQEKVDRFQTDPECPYFLISLKAGGVGLNLTAADYIFILDPWWNPAVEAQAIDRAHRIGQTKRVFAYRLIAKDTVEDKILQLQSKKKSLAEAILSAENRPLADLTAEDLNLLLS